ncbi:hypothetical protein EHP00_415 [Ecytonucleospora hepatopenaei]|uniref:Uncharacterized protein n=1 Tax=Ecytonucleospora hepatopenaei TaxID=646526 RepID=A0A1W0E9G7_9MICR|nr:hypothetical protein EHP00_415 [Ecytonucleospora hepatopenaei]
MLYVEKIYNSTMGTVYSLSILFISSPCVNVIFMTLLANAFEIPQNYRFLFYGFFILLVMPLPLIPVELKSKVAGYLGYVQQAVLCIIGLSLPVALIMKKKNPMIKLNEEVKQGPITLMSFLETMSEVYFSYVGFTEANSLPKEQVGKLYVPYLCSTTVLFVLYMVLDNFFLLIYRKDGSEINYLNVLGFLRGGAKPVYLMIVCALYTMPFVGMSFMTSTNIVYIKEKYNLHDSIKYVIVTAGALLMFIASYMQLGLIMNIVCGCMIFFSMLAMAGILFHARRNPKYKMKIPKLVVFISVGFAAIMLGTNITFIIKGFIKSNKN